MVFLKENQTILIRKGTGCPPPSHTHTRLKPRFTWEATGKFCRFINITHIVLFTLSCSHGTSKAVVLVASASWPTKKKWDVNTVSTNSPPHVIRREVWNQDSLARSSVSSLQISNFVLDQWSLVFRRLQTMEAKSWNCSGAHSDSSGSTQDHHLGR